MRTVVAALLFVLLSGCIFTDGILGTRDTATAKMMLPEARREVLDLAGSSMADGRWRFPDVAGELRLAAIYALETRGTPSPDDTKGLVAFNLRNAHTTTDARLGDGYAAAWGFQFSDDVKVWQTDLNVRMGVSGTGWGSYQGGGYVSMGDADRTFTDWTWDSDAAADVAMGIDGWPEALDAATFVVYVLYVPDGQTQPYWLLAAHDEDKRPLGHVLVSAATGEVPGVWDVHPPTIRTSEDTRELQVQKQHIEVLDFRDVPGHVVLRFGLDPLDLVSEVQYTLRHGNGTVAAEGRLWGADPEDEIRLAVAPDELSGHSLLRLDWVLARGVTTRVTTETCFVGSPWIEFFGMPPNDCGL